VSAVGHCHIDTAWLWTYRETRRKIRRSWASQLAYLDEYPDYKFVITQASQLDWLERDDPQLFGRVAEAVAAGRFIILGGTWVEMDANVSSSESFTRQFLLGQKYFEEKFNVRSEIFWLPDTFGYSSQIPQLCRLAGMKYFLTQKLSWNEWNRIPHNTFDWIGLDGSDVIAHFPPADNYNCEGAVAEIVKCEQNQATSGLSPRSLMLFGIGDGGGGPTRAMLERLERVKDLRGLPKVQQRSPQEFFELLEQDAAVAGELATIGHDESATAGVPIGGTSFGPTPAALPPSLGGGLPKWVGELYFERHRGTYTTQGKTKRGNRLCQTALHDAEVLCSAASTLPSEKDANGWPRSWANFSLLWLYSHRNAWANYHILGQPNTFLAARLRVPAGRT
jgi:alpha-mannosidase